ncbi:MAG: zinc-dependent alcohol dehydrogenase [Myxococcota bacterium]
MRAVCWNGVADVRVKTVPDPTIINPRDAIIRVTSTAICGSDLHLYSGDVPAMRKGDILGHEFMGEVVELGPEVKNLQKGDRVLVPFPIACGACFFCKRELWSCCDNSNPNAAQAEEHWGHSPAGLFGYSHLTGGYAGGQAQYVRVPFADVGPLKVPEGLRDEQVLFLTDILPTAWQAAEHCNIQRGDTVAIWGAGPVGLLTVVCAYAMGAERVIIIDRVPERLETARRKNAVIINDEKADVGEVLRDITGGRGPDATIDAVGMEAHDVGLENAYDRARHAMRLETDRPHALREAIMHCRKGGVVSVPGFYSGTVDRFPMGAVANKGLTLRSGQAHVHRYMRPLLDRIQRGELDATFIITHRLPLEEAAHGYDIFKNKREDCIKVVLTP